nr:MULTISPECIES: hypothetical protein [unclassified Bradyrhizobium]
MQQRDARVVPVGVAEQPSEIDDRIDVIGGTPDQVAEYVVGEIAQLEHRQCAGEAELRRRIVRPQRQRGGVGGQRLRVLAALQQQNAEIAMRLAVGGIEPDRFLDQLQRALVLVPLQRDHAADMQDVRPHLGFLLHRLEQQIRAVQLAVTKQHDGAVHDSLDEFRAPPG